MRFTILVLSFLIFGSCGKDDPQEEQLLNIRTGIAYGFCQGLCDHEYLIEEEAITYSKKSNLSSVEEEVCNLPMVESQWEELEQLVDDRFFALDSVYGCPNCVDQGSEYIIVATDMREYGIYIDPNIEIAIHPIVEELRNIRYEATESPICK